MTAPARTRRPASAVGAVLLTLLQAGLVAAYVFGASWDTDGGTPPLPALVVLAVAVLALLGAVAVWRGTGRGLLLTITVVEVLVVVAAVVAFEIGIAGVDDVNGFRFGAVLIGGIALVLPLLRLVLLTRRSVRGWTA